MSESKRLDWIDALKGFGIFLVTFGHLKPWMRLETYIYSFHMFLFFFLSGYLFREKETTMATIKRKVWTILVPFSAWNVLSLVWNLVIRHYSGLQLVENFFIFDGDNNWNAPIWFMGVLFLTEILFIFFAKLPKKWWMNAILMCVCAVLWYFFGECRWYLNLNLVPMALFFFAGGNLFAMLQKQGAFAKLPKAIPYLAIVAFAIAGAVIGVLLNERVSYVYRRFQIVPFTILAGMFSVLFWVLYFEKMAWVGKLKPLLWMGKNSMIIMATQYYFFFVWSKISQKFFGYDVWMERNTIKAFLVAIGTIALILGIVWLYKKIFAKSKLMLKLGEAFGVK